MLLCKENFIKKRQIIFAFLFCTIGIFVRVFRFGQVPCGFNQDEAFAAYEALSILRDGVDSAGYRFPTYFVSWGSGMNVLESYLAIPFFCLFGVSEITFRLPQLICSCISLPVFYCVCKRLLGNKTALIGLGILAISPWHIMLSRWGLESNLAPAFLLFGFFFLLKGLDKNLYFLLSALCYGLSLYAYSITWLAVPFSLLAFGSYIIISGYHLKFRWVLGAALILVVFALPHILFLMINRGWIPEVRTANLSIPKMTAMRSSEIALSNLWSGDSWKNYFSILLFQTDGLTHNAISGFGMFYGISSLFFIIGFAQILNDVKNGIKQRNLCSEGWVLLGFIACSIVSLIISGANINKTNCLHFFTLLIIVKGIETVICHCNTKSIRMAIVCGYSVFFLLFSLFYFGEYNNIISEDFRLGVGDAVGFVKQESHENVAVDPSIFHSQILFYDQTPQKVFEETVVYEDTNATYRTATRFGNYTFGFEESDGKEFDAYIVCAENVDMFASSDFTYNYFNEYVVVVPRLDN